MQIFDQEISRRRLLCDVVACAALLPTSALLAACGSDPAEEPVDDTSDADAALQAGSSSEDAENAGESSAAQTGATLVAYFSATGHTADVAAAIAEHLGADVFEITPAEPYTTGDLNYNDSGSRASVERAEDARPELAQMTPDGFSSYDTVFVGYPIWWGDAAWPVKTFAEGNDFSGKTVVPFCTSASSGIGGSGDELAGLAGTGEWVDGERFSASTPTVDVTDWVDGLGL